MTGTKNDSSRQVFNSIDDPHYEAFHLAEQVGMPLSEAEALIQLYGGERNGRERQAPKPGRLTERK